MDFTYAPHLRYRDYLAAFSLRENIDIVVSKPIRQAIGSIEDIFQHNTPALSAALKDLMWFRGGPNENIEVIRLNLYAQCASLDARSADSVNGFQALFVKPDEWDGFAQLGAPDAPEAPGGDACAPYGAALALAARDDYARAIQVLSEPHDGCELDWRCDHLRAVLLAGIPGQPKSAGTVDFDAAEQAFDAAARRARAESPAEAVRARVGAGRCAYGAGRFADAAAHFHEAIKLDPHCGEGHYQLVRLSMQVRDRRGARRYLAEAFDCHWSYGVRAACDPLLAARHAQVIRGMRAAIQGIIGEARAALAETSARLRFLKRQEHALVPVAELPGYRPLAAELSALSRRTPSRLLKRASDWRKQALALRAQADRLAADYCALLRASEHTIVLHRNRIRRRREPEVLARHVRRRMRWLPQSLSGRLELPVTALLVHVQLLALRHAFRRNVARTARNRVALHDRLQRIERRFGLRSADAMMGSMQTPADGFMRLVPAE